jgi:hypothetical protein
MGRISVGTVAHQSSVRSPSLSLPPPNCPALLLDTIVREIVTLPPFWIAMPPPLHESHATEFPVITLSSIHTEVSWEYTQ